MLRVGDDELEVVTAPTNPEALGAKVRFGAGVSGKVAATLKPMLVSGRINQRTIAVDSNLCLPLLDAGELFGILNINAPAVHTFTDHDLVVGSEFCAHAADALTAARQYHEGRLAGDEHRSGTSRRCSGTSSRPRRSTSSGRRRVTGWTLPRSSIRHGLRRPCWAADVVPGRRRGRIIGDGMAVRRLLQELIDNAHRHGKRPVVLAVETTPEAVEVTVSDRGPGVPEDERDRLFEPYALGRAGRRTLRDSGSAWRSRGDSPSPCGGSSPSATRLKPARWSWCDSRWPRTSRPPLQVADQLGVPS